MLPSNACDFCRSQRVGEAVCQSHRVKPLANTLAPTEGNAISQKEEILQRHFHPVTP
jgi:hypothetical protein